MNDHKNSIHINTKNINDFHQATKTNLFNDYKEIIRSIYPSKKRLSKFNFMNSIKISKKRNKIFKVIMILMISLWVFFIVGLRNGFAQFNPTDISELVFFVESKNIDTSNHVAYCESDFCLNHPNTEGAIIAEQYCDVTNDCGEGCVRRWIDQSNYIINNNGNPPVFNPPEYTNGRNFGQDDRVKPCYINDCINGQPCVRGGGGEPFATDGSEQDKYLEIQIKDFIYLDGGFSIFLLAKPIAQTEDWFYFGQAVSFFRHRVAENYLQLRVPGNPVYRVTTNNSVTLNEWQLIEVHRDDSDKITVYINGIDKTNSPAITLAGTFNIGYLLSAFKTDAETGNETSMHGDVAAFLVYDKNTSTIENNDIREYFDTNYLAGTLSVEQNNISGNLFEVFPNPAQNTISIKNIKQGYIDTVQIYDLLGRLVKQVNVNKAEEELKINISNLQDALYQIIIKSNENQTIKRFFKY